MFRMNAQRCRLHTACKLRNKTKKYPRVSFVLLVSCHRRLLLPESKVLPFLTRCLKTVVLGCHKVEAIFVCLFFYKDGMSEEMCRFLLGRCEDRNSATSLNQKSPCIVRSASFGFKREESFVCTAAVHSFTTYARRRFAFNDHPNTAVIAIAMEKMIVSG